MALRLAAGGPRDHRRLALRLQRQQTPLRPRRTHSSRILPTVDHDPPTPSRIATGPPNGSPSGFVGYPAARCDPGSAPAVMGRTTQSLLVVCEIGPANYYYRGLRLSDGASIELANAVRSSDGFDVTNPVDGTRYQVRPTGISITSPGGQ